MQANNETGPILASTHELSHGIVDNGRHFLTRLGDLAGRAVQVVYHHVPLSSVISLVNGLFFCVANAIANRVNKKWVTDQIMQKNEPFTPKETQYKNAFLDGCVAIVVVLGEMAVTKMLRQKGLQSQRSLAITFITSLITRHVFRPNDKIIELMASEAKGKLTQTSTPPSSSTDSVKPTFLSLLIDRNLNAEHLASSAPKKPIQHLSDYAPSDFDSNVRRNIGLWKEEATQMLQKEIERSTQADYQLPTSGSLEGELIRIMIDLNAEQSSPIDFSQAENLGAREQLILLQQALTRMLTNNDSIPEEPEEEEEVTEEDSESNVSNDQDDDASFINSEIGRLEDYSPADESLTQTYKEWFLENKEERLQFLNRMKLKTQQTKSLPEQRSPMAFDIRKLILVAQSYNPDLKTELEKLHKPSEQLTRLHEELQKIEVPSQPESAST